ncbi:MAG: type II toxin-antitoxin system VapC family toxin [Candidatus Thiodiazotropha sp. (ex. Lucinisca nassula)]|nr:type II toxin-antitoxin system VapC family toxin [Candidatus Thiodiazotropha sp. (ex. Lucinisca nassula)]MBW9274948.1 type II toxin-antitoxin system VapC family toxin [Candidatus Thiodiazotropha sp. (ex. Lucinisca nassula)]PUB85241.1 MAG: PIN domain nuclease [gamma proteobacterium symbiont of Ctena orbiculata]PUB90764.1 MAG: PIN domain nuclease [gamma proteobacterium symbiont of Ctena orbiculata]
MIAVDTNAILRCLLEDGAGQFVIAARLITGKRPVLVTDAVLVELIWTLRGKKYQLKKPDAIAVILALIHEPNIRFEDGQVVWMALNGYRKSKPVNSKEADFADALIVNKAKSIAVSKKQRYQGSYTFDTAAQSLPGAKAPIG